MNTSSSPPSTLEETGQELKNAASSVTSKASELLKRLKANFTGPASTGGRKVKRTRRRGKKGGSFSMKWLKGKFSGSKKRKTGRKSRKHRR